MSKGSQRRPTDEKTYGKNYEDIFGKNKTKEPKKEDADGRDKNNKGIK